jgi:peroxiredoxin
MKSALFATGAVAVAAAAISLGAMQAGHAASPAPAVAYAGKHVDNFQLTSSELMAYSLYYYKYAPAIVVMSRTNGSAYSETSTAELQKLAASYKEKGVLFLLLDSNKADSRDAVAAEVAKHGITLPVLMDEEQLVGEQLGVKQDGEVFVIDPKTWTVAYHGPVDKAVSSAIDSVSAGQPVQTAVLEMKQGKTIAFPERSGDFSKISYSKTIAPILDEKCVTCHISGGIGPFTLDSYEKVKGYAPMIRETVRTKRMPPYFADPHIGTFKSAQGLTEQQTKLLVHWIEAGAPRGEGADPLLANANKVAPEWPVALGKPDVIVDIPAFAVPATGVVEYQNQRVQNPFTENTWLRAIAIKPGERSVLHHVVSNWVQTADAPKATIPGGSVGSYTPGAEPQIMAAGSGAPVPAGGKLNFQMHYTTTGKAATDHTQVGFYTLKTPPQFIKRSAVIGDFALYIPAGEARHKEVAYMVAPADMELTTLYPHSHYRGMHVELKQKTPDGKETMLLALPKYDFNWQRDYDPVKPIIVKKGTKLIATWVYDNSMYNKANPDYKRNVTWGEQTPDEMMYFRINYRFLDETVKAPRNDLQNALQATLQFGALDDNADDFITMNELQSPRVASTKARFAQLDKNHDGKISRDEFSGTDAKGSDRNRGVEVPDL